jgi:hypothetical protein
MYNEQRKEARREARGGGEEEEKRLEMSGSLDRRELRWDQGIKFIRHENM